jgi:hypothetical protein
MAIAGFSCCRFWPSRGRLLQSSATASNFRQTFVWCLSNFHYVMLMYYHTNIFSCCRPNVLPHLCHVVLSSNAMLYYHSDVLSCCHIAVLLFCYFIQPSSNVCPLPFVFIEALYSSITGVLYWYKILGHGTTPCPRMMRAILLNQSPSINCEVTHNPSSRFL